MLARVLASCSVAVALVVGPVVAAPAAQADEVSSAQARVNHLQRQVARTTERLVSGTRAWERDQARLRAVRARLAAVQARVAAQEAIAAEGRARVAVVARRMYMSPVNDRLRMAASMDAEQVLGMLRTEGELKHIAAGDGEVVRRARVAQLELARSRTEIAALGRDAQRLVAQSAARLAELNALADRTSRDLVSAQSALTEARARKASRLAALAEARARASRLRMSAATGALCRTSSTEGMSNGNLDPAVLCPLWRAPGHRLRTDAARAYDRMSTTYAKATGRPLCVTDSYRTYAEQVDVYHRKPGLAAVPGTSNHGWGRALDLCGGVQTFGTAAHEWMQANAGRFGWHHPDWARQGGSKPEAWHWEFGG